MALNAEAIHTGDFISAPDFPDRWLVVRARHLDLSGREPELTLFLDLLPENQTGDSLGTDNVIPLFPSD